jgi:ComF family protein
MRWREPLCAGCLREASPLRRPFCLRCGQPVPASAVFCRACASKPSPCRIIRAAFLYRGPIPGVVHAFKYRGRRKAARAAGLWMAARLHVFPELSGCDALVPVPLHATRLRERGYNQARLLAEALAPSCGLPVLDLLERVRPTLPQWDLDRAARRRNLREAFRAKAEASGLSLLLIDDVCTSTASLDECGRALNQAGAERVAAYVLARQSAGGACS